MRRSLHHRPIALLLSWAVPATNSWGMAPPIVQPGGGDFEATASAGLSEPSPSGGGDGPAVRPLLECVRKKANGSFTAFFGYKNESSSPVTIPIGHHNGFFPGADNRGQPTTFQPGRSPHYPNPAFGVDFGGLALIWTLRGPDGDIRTAIASPFSPRCAGGPSPSPSPTPAPTPTPVATPPPPPSPGCEMPIFGPKRYTRTRGFKTTYEASFAVPASAAGPFTLSVENGEAHGHKRALAWIRLNGQLVVRPRDFHRHRGRGSDDDDEDDDEDHRGCGSPQASLERPIALTPGTTATLKVTLVGSPGSHVTVRICGRNGDLTPPSVTWSEPPAGGFTSDTTPKLVVRYQDAMSGVDTSSLRALLDDVDVSSLFTLGSDEANAELPDAMALQEGAHTLRAEVRDRAGNLGGAASSFRVDLTPPVLALRLSDGAYVGQLDPSGNFTINGSVSDVDPGVSIVCGVAGQSYPGTIQNGQFTCSVPLTEGKNSVSVRASDSTGHVTEETRTVNYDRTAPVAQFVEPTSGTFTAATSIEVTAQALDASPVTGTVNGAPASCAATAPAGPDGQALYTCTGTAPLVDGTNAIVFVATDAAGNSSQAQALVVVDRVAPLVAIGSPAAGSYHSGGMLTVSGTVTDTAPVVVEVNGIPATCGGLPTCAAGGASFTATIPATDGPFAVRADARDAAGNLGSAEVGVNVDSAPPLITITAPADGFVTNASELTIAGTLTDGSPSSAFIEGQPVPCNGSGGSPFTCAFAGPVALAAEGTASFDVRARDAAGNESARSVAVTVDRTAPGLTVESPAEGAPVGALPVAVLGTVSDANLLSVTVDGAPASVTGNAWLLHVDGLFEGDHSFEIVARDKAGNQTLRPRQVVVDLGPPVLTIASPESGLLTRASEVMVNGSVADRSDVIVRARGTPFQVSLPRSPSGAPLPFSLGPLPLQENDNPFVIEAIDATNRSFEIPLTVTRDQTPPTVELSGSDSISRGRAGHVTVAASDSLGLDHVVVTLACVSGSGGATCAPTSQTFTTSPVSVPLLAPEEAKAGDTLVVSAEAFDRAGNSRLASRSVSIVSDGAVVGQVSSDVTGLPLSGATVGMVVGATGTASDTSDERGRYSLPTASPRAVLLMSKEGFTSVEREVGVASGSGTVPVDARLTPLASEQATDGSSPVLAGPWSLALAPGTHRLTRLSNQGLPNLLPLGWSPVSALDWRAASGAAAANATVTGLPNTTLHLARYDFALHSWRLIAAGLTPVDGVISTGLPETGAYALVAPDAVEPPIAIPAAGGALAGIAMVSVPATATSTGQVDPAVIPPTGGTAQGNIVVSSPVALPSGTVIQAEVTETYELLSGQQASEEKRLIDIVLFRAQPGTDVNVSRDCPPNSPPGSLCASFPITPSRTYTTADLASGKVHLDILAGREGVRGTVGGSQPVTLDAGAARLFVARNALSEHTAFALEEHALSAFLPSTTALVPLAEVVADFGGQTLSIPAELSISSPGIGASDTLVFAGVERVDGIPRYAVVALGQLVNDRIVSRPYSGLAGVVKGGRYVLYRLGAPIGFVAGIVSSSVGPVKALVEPAPGDPGSLPFIAFAGVEGSYILASATGPRNFQARVVGVALVGGGSAVVPAPDASNAPETTSLNLTLAGTVTTASVSPPDGTLGVNTTTAIEISSNSALNPATVVPANFALTKLGATPLESASVAFRLVLASSGKLVSVIPQPALEYSKVYRLEASGLVDQVGGAVVVPPTSFRTKDFVSPFYDPKKLVFSMPNQDGIVMVTAPGCHPEPGCFAPGTTILIINSGNGVVLSLTAGNSGEINSELPASINDTIFVTINDPLGNTVSFQKSEFIDQATGETGVGPGGGTVRSLDGQTELRIPEGALENGVTFKVSVVPESELENLFPNDEHERILEGGHLGSMVRIEPSQDTRFRKEVDLAFPLPDFTTVPENQRPANPKDAFYFIHRRVERCPDGTTTCPADQRIVVFEAIDDAKVEGEGANARVVTASFPFSGITVAWATLGITLMVLGWYLKDAQSQLPPVAAVSGKVLRAKFNETTKTLEYVAVEGAQVSGFDLSGERLINKAGGSYATSQKDGTFALTDPHYSGGQISIYAMLGEEVAQATAFEVTGGFAAKFRKGATANITFPEQAEPPPPPLLQIHVRRKSDAQEVGGYAVAGVPLRVSFTSNYAVVRAQIEGQNHNVTNVNSPDLLTWEMEGDYVPAEVGTVEIVATARSTDTGASVTVSRSLRVLAPGGAVDNVPSKPPRVTAVEPKADDVGVSVGAFLQVFFSEPVRNIKDAATSMENVTLAEVDQNNAAGPPLPIRISGVRPTGEPVSNITSASETVTSLSIEPLLGMRYGQRYRVSLSSGIQDLDKDVQQNPAPKALVPFTWSFETFGPEFVGGSAQATGSPGIAVIGSRAYLARTNGFINGTLEGYRIDDPVLPVKLQEEEFFAPRPYDIVGTGDDGARLVAIATGSTSQSKPASVLLYDVTNDDDFKWVGAATLASNAYEGFITRLAIFNGSVYAATVRRGIQVVDIAQAKAQIAALIQRPNSLFALQQARSALNSDGEGFGHGAVVQTLALPQKPNNTDYYLNDLKVADLAGQTVVVVAGEPGLVVASPAFGTINYNGKPEKTETLAGGGQRVVKLEWGHTLALARLNDRDVAVVVGLGKIDGVAKTLLLSIDLASLDNPAIAGYLDLGSYLGGLQPVDVLVKDQTALIGLQNGARDQGAVLLVSLADVTKPAFAGRLAGDAGKPLGGRLALTDTGLLLTTAKASLGGATPLGGIRTAAFDTVGAVLPPNPVLAKFVPGSNLAREETLKDIPLQMRTYPKSQKVPEVILELFEGTAPVQPPLAFTLAGGAASYTVPKGLRKDVKKDITAKLSFTFKGQLVSSAPRLLPITAIRLTLDSNNDTVVEDKDDDDVIQDPNGNDPSRAIRLTFWEADARFDPKPSMTAGTGIPPEPFPAEYLPTLTDFALLRLQLRSGLADDERIGVVLKDSRLELVEKADPVVGWPSSCLGDPREYKGKEHLCHRETANAQSLLHSSMSTRLKPKPATAQGVVEIPSELLKKGDNFFLFRCKGQGGGAPECPGTSLEVVRLTEQGQETIDTRRVELLPLQKLAGMVSLRRVGNPDSEDPRDPHFRLAPEERFVPGWALIPAGIKDITLFVHGYNITDGEFQGRTARSWFGTWIKRLYWAGHKALPVQGGFSVGVSWPGDIPGDVGVVPKALPYYPEDEFNALQAGLPLGAFIADLRQRTGLEKLNILAHSLGNLVVNNALKEIPPTGSAVINYVMNQAAVASEAFGDEYNPIAAASTVSGLAELLQHAQNIGFPDPQRGQPNSDLRWVEDEGKIEKIRQTNGCLTGPTTYSPSSQSTYCRSLAAAGVPDPQCKCDDVTRYFSLRYQVNPELDPTLQQPATTASTPFFRTRWGKLGRNSDANQSPKGPWTQFFFTRINPQRTPDGIRIFNTFNTQDSVLRIDGGFGGFSSATNTPLFHVWRVGQIKGKPFKAISGVLDFGLSGTFGRDADDPLDQQKWWTLELPGRPSWWRSTAETEVLEQQRSVWNGRAPDGATLPEDERLKAIARRTRLWAELAIWYPALSPASGTVSLPALSGEVLPGVDLLALPGQGRNVDFSDIGGEGGLDPADASSLSHSYMAVLPMHQVWRGYRVIRNIFKATLP